MSFSDMEIRNTGKFLKIESGQPRLLRILEESPTVKILHGFGKEATTCAGEHCMECAAGREPSQRFTVNVYSHDFKKVMLWEFGSGIGKQLKEIAKTMKSQDLDITEVDLTVSATGSNMTKKYMVQPMVKSKPVPEGLALHKTDQDIPF